MNDLLGQALIVLVAIVGALRAWELFSNWVDS